MFQKATKRQAKLRLALFGPAGSGKTFTALCIAQELGGRVAVLDTEHGSASKYADLFDFDVTEPDDFNPLVYINAIKGAEEAGYDVLVIDSLTHAWSGKGGALELVDRAASRNHGNSFAGWKDVTPLHNRLVDTMLAARLHLIVTMRSKTEYVIEEDSRGKKVPRKLGLAPVQRDGMEYEFDVVGDMDNENGLSVTKSRCRALAGEYIAKPGADLARKLVEWLSDGAPVPMVTDEQRAEMLALSAEIGIDAQGYVTGLLANPLTEQEAAKSITALRARWKKMQPAEAGT